MNKDKFLLTFYDALHGLPIDDVERSIAYYHEIINTVSGDAGLKLAR